jgi:hypothetical protein
VAVVDPRTGERLVEVPLGETGPVVRISPVGA